MEPTVLFEDGDVIAVSKPVGVLTTDLQYGIGYAHRLDRETSGVLLFAKNEKALEFLRQAFHDRRVQKTYLALVYGILKEKKGTIDFDIGRSRKDFRLRSAQPKARGTLRTAITHYEVLGDDGAHSLVKVMPVTGRTHQIRVHFKAIHHPIVGDPLYAPNHPDSLNLGRMGLHAHMIKVPLPSGEEKEIIAPLPPVLEEVCAKFARL
jgi:23S rRNA pseudouridine1911/1915/1917 synthase